LEVGKQFMTIAGELGIHRIPFYAQTFGVVYANCGVNSSWNAHSSSSNTEKFTQAVSFVFP
jgi:hypothetical protein